MARSQNPMDVHRRTQRKKELKKLKTNRLQARDEKVKQTETVASVTKAIRELEKKKDRKNGHLDQHETKQLERLQKDLRLVKQAAQERAAAPPKAPVAPTRPLTELDNPAKSVYYDPQMNPYGAPPPGKPRLYHKRGGGTTMDIELAIVPGEEEEEEASKEAAADKVVPPPPPPPPQPRHQGYAPPPPPPRQSAAPPQLSVPPPPPPPLPQEPPPPPPPPKDPSQVPALPPPSKSVKRSRKRKLDADIWASMEEVEYERTTNQLDLEEGTAVAHVWVDQWYYTDTSGRIQGPFDSQQMQEWHEFGYFQPTTPVRNGETGNFTEMAKVNWMSQVNKANRISGGHVSRDSIDDRIAALKRQDQESSVEDRIAALREQHVREEKPVEDRIAALRDEMVKDEEAATDSIDDRIAALRRQHVSQQEAQHADQAADDTEPVPAYDIGEVPVYHQEQEEIPIYYPEESANTGIEDLAKDGSGEQVPVYYPSEEAEQRDAEAAPAPLEQQEEPPSHPIQVETVENDEEVSKEQGELADLTGAVEAPPSYPVLPVEEATDAVAPYPSDLEYPVTDAYPDVGAAYPVSDPYPSGPDAYPATDVYPGADDSVGAYVFDEPQDESNVAAKKVYKGDKEVVGLVPSHLQKRRPQSKQPKKQLKKAPAQVPPENKNVSVSQDVDDFMKEINALK